MSLKARQELLAVTGPRYQAVSWSEKQTILNEFVAATGYHRKYAIHQLCGYPFEPSAGERKEHPRRYTAEVQEALIKVWEAANRICAKRLVPFLPEMVAALERCGHLSLSAEVKDKLLGISPATVDRLLAPLRRTEQGHQPRGGTSAALLKQQVPIRTFGEWQGARPGFMEADLVAHCGGDVSGSYLHTLVMTDVVTGWTECLALLFRDQQMVVQAVRQAQGQLPVPLLALDTDNGSEFLNNTLLDYCEDQGLTFTRSRPYKKNDQCFVEQKNGAIIRHFIGYERFEGVEPCRILTELYRSLRLYINFFQPSLKLIAKKRVGSRVIKKYDLAQTPYQRILAADTISSQIKAQLKTQFASLDPVQLLTQIQTLQDELWRYAFVGRTIKLSGSLPNDPALPAAAQPLSTVGSIGDKQAGKLIPGVNGTGHPPKGQSPISTQTQSEIKELSQRKYRRSKRQRRPYPGPRWWRTRQDPFAQVWPQAQQQLEQTPDLTAKTLFETLQRQYPDQFPDDQLRTFQRRVRAWRMAYLTRKSEPDEPAKVLLQIGGEHDR
jgi:hypothetical protein